MSVSTEIASGVASGVPWQVYVDDGLLVGSRRLYIQRGDGTLTVSLSRLITPQGVAGQVIDYWFLTESDPQIFVASVDLMTERAVVQYLTGSDKELTIIALGTGSGSLALVAGYLESSTATFRVQGPGFSEQLAFGEVSALGAQSRMAIGRQHILDL